MSKLPVLLSIPHGGTEIPPEIASRVILTPKDQFQDSDALTREIYSLKNEVQVLVEGNIARAFVDLNREAHDRPPQNPDGVVKSKTCFGKPIYHPGKELDEETTEMLLGKYYHPYHDLIEKTLRSPADIRLMLDCHTMEAVGPEISPDRGQVRPMFCLGSNFGKSCPAEAVQRMAECVRTVFELNEGDVVIDKPFAGGYITRKYGNNPVPCIQIEMSRGLYLAQPWYDQEHLKVSTERLAHLNNRFLNVLKCFFN